MNSPQREPSEKPSDKKSRRRSLPVRGELLRSLRAARGWSQRAAAEAAQVSDRLIRRAEAGGPLDAASVRILAALYKMPEAAVASAPGHEDSAAAAAAPPDTGIAAKAKRFMEENWNQGRLDAIEELLHPEFKFHHESGTVHNREEMRQRIMKFRESFGVFDFVVEEATDHGEFVVLRWRCVLMHSGVWLDLPPSHRRVVVYGSSWVQVVAGKFADAWDFWDPGLVYQQLAAPSEAPASPPGGPGSQ